MPRFVLAELGHELLVVDAGPEIDDEAAAARRKTREADVAFVAARIRVVVRAEADDRRAPHLRRRARDVLHHCDELVAVAAFDLALDLVDELDRIDCVQLGLGCALAHRTLLGRRQTAGANSALSVSLRSIVAACPNSPPRSASDRLSSRGTPGSSSPLRRRAASPAMSPRASRRRTCRRRIAGFRVRERRAALR